MDRLIPKIFYDRMEEALDFWVAGLGFTLGHRDATLAVVEKGNLKAYLVESPEFAAKDRPELAIETGDIEANYADIAARRPDLLHPNGKTISQKPWGAREFALLDKTGVCVIFRQF